MAVGASSGVRTWLHGGSPVVPNRPPFRKHCLNFCRMGLMSQSSAAFQVPLKGDQARDDLWALHPQPILSREREDGIF